MNEETVLGIAQSVSSKRWVQRTFDERMALTLAQRMGLSALTAQVLAARGVDLEKASDFLSPTLRDLLPDPLSFQGMAQAIERLCQAIDSAQTICVYGDYDVDGATSSAVLLRYLKSLGAKTMLYIPDRLKEGYGPNTEAMDTIKAKGAEVVVTVDCGTTSFDPLAHAKSIGLDVIVVDHHEAESRHPECIALINPKRLDESGDFAHLAAVGVTFLVCVGLNRALRDRGAFEKDLQEPNLMALLDLVALGTICDVVPLKGINRAFVVQGLKMMAKRNNPGLTALQDCAGINEAPEAYHAGFILGPRVNAGGRVGESYLGAELLSSQNPARCAEIAALLDSYNHERKEIEQQVLDEAIQTVEGQEHKGLVMAVGRGWHPGVIGIVASRLKERYNLPACVISFEAETGHGSGRSVSGVDLGAAVIAAKHQGLLSRGGGHTMAAGFSLTEDQLAAFQDFMTKRLSGEIVRDNIVATYTLDGIVSCAGLTPSLVEELDRIGPFGSGNPQPRFVLADMYVTRADVVGKDHVRCFLKDSLGAQMKAIAFRALDTPLGELLLGHKGRKLHLAGRAKLDTWGGGHSVQFQIDDAALAG